MLEQYHKNLQLFRTYKIPSYFLDVMYMYIETDFSTATRTRLRLFMQHAQIQLI